MTAVSSPPLILPRGLIFLASIWLIGSWFITIGLRTPIQPVSASYTPAVRMMLLCMVVGLMVGWPLLRLSLAPLLPGAIEVTVTRAEPTRSLDPNDVAAVVRRLAPGVELRAIPNPFLALRSARERQASDEILCAAGSVYLAGIARRVFSA